MAYFCFLLTNLVNDSTDKNTDLFYTEKVRQRHTIITNDTGEDDSEGGEYHSLPTYVLCTAYALISCNELSTLSVRMPSRPNQKINLN